MINARIVGVFGIALALAACGEQAIAIGDTAMAESFVGERLPAGAADIRTKADQGIDGLVLLRFTAPAKAAAVWAERVLGAAPTPSADPMMDGFGSGTDGWISALPAGAASERADDASVNRHYRLVIAPAGNDRATVWLAAFST